MSSFTDKDTEAQEGDCAVCSTTCRQRCASCHEVFYCTRECQASHWSAHKDDCRQACIGFPPPPRNKLLIIGGLMFDLEEDFNVSALVSELRRTKVEYEAIDATPSTFMKTFFKKMASKEFTTCVIFQLGSGGSEKADKRLRSAEMQTFFREWVRQGGKLIVTGERHVYDFFNDLFGTSWTAGAYYRVSHGLNTKSPHIPNKVLAKLPQSINCKACNVRGVKPDEILYTVEDKESTGYSLVPGFVQHSPTAEDETNPQCCAAMGVYENGRFAFFGDVNGEKETMAALSIIGTYPSPKEENFMRRRNYLEVVTQFQSLHLRLKGEDDEVNDSRGLSKTLMNAGLCKQIGQYI